MYAVIRSGSKQYKVSPGDFVTVEKLKAAEGKKVNFDDVLLFHDGKKLTTETKGLSRVKVAARVVEQGKSDKTIVFKYKPKKGYKKKRGHRQQLTRVEILDIIEKKPAPKSKAAQAAGEGAEKKSED